MTANPIMPGNPLGWQSRCIPFISFYDVCQKVWESGGNGSGGGIDPFEGVCLPLPAFLTYKDNNEQFDYGPFPKGVDFPTFPTTKTSVRREGRSKPRQDR
jgi:hypothetical protein